MTSNSTPPPTTQQVPVWSLQAAPPSAAPSAPSAAPAQRELIVELPVRLEIETVGTYTIMCTPGDLLALAAGFAFAEGLIEQRDDIALLQHCPDDPALIRMQLTPAHRDIPHRTMAVITSCGACGSDDVQEMLRRLPTVPDRLRVSAGDLARLPELLRHRQKLFQRTGGTHAVALFRAGTLLALAEDVGRHNAFDKAVGTCLLHQRPTAGTIAVLSGRVSFDLAAKAARAGVELIAAVSAPTSLALTVARHCGITLCGFVRGTEATVYCHPQRLTDLADQP